MIVPPSPHTDADALVARALGVVLSPRSTLERVARRPNWLGVVVLAFIVTAGCAAALFSTEVGQVALLDQWERTTSAFGLTLDDGQYAAAEGASRHGLAYAALSAFAAGPVLALALSGLLFGIFRIAVRSDVSYRQVLAVVGHAGVILAVRELVAAPVTYAREALASPLTLGTFFRMMDDASPITRFLGIIDLFVIWWILVIAIGMSVLYRRPTRRLAGVFVGAYFALAAVMAVAMVLTRGTA